MPPTTRAVERQPLQMRWIGIWPELVTSEVHMEMFMRLCELYGSPNRYYHSLSNHIVSCLDVFDEVRGFARVPQALQLAIWFHDPIYEAGSTENERKSLELFREFAVKAKLPERITRLVCGIIPATTHREEDLFYHPDCYLMLDIDLFSFAKAPDEFDSDTDAIRAEHANFSEGVFRQKQRAFLTMLQARGHIFLTEHFRSVYEKQAQGNLIRALSRLGST